MATAAGGMLALGLAVYRRAKRAERDNPPIGRFVEVGGVRLHVLDRGEGDAVVILHGNGSMIQDFVASGLVDLLAARHRVIVFDRPGYGYSERPRMKIWTPAVQAKVLRAALRCLGVERPIVVGHSWGTLPAVELGLQYPDEIGGLVLLSGHYYPTPRLDVATVSPAGLPIIGDVLRYTIYPLVGALFARPVIRRLFAPAPVPRKFSAFPIAMALRPWQIRASAVESGLMLAANAANRSRYGELDVPVAILAGADDRIVDTRRQSQRLHAEIPHSTMRIAPVTGHMIHHTAPVEIMDAIDEVGRSARRRR